jgi:ABC-type cobalamin/Fe3+-siderophores transport system ATPase subunit
MSGTSVECYAVLNYAEPAEDFLQLAIENVSKRYGSNNWALRNFTLQLGPGVLGLLGPNGAGKTTLMSIQATITRATEGRVEWNGADLASDVEFLEYHGPGAPVASARLYGPDAGVEHAPAVPGLRRWTGDSRLLRTTRPPRLRLSRRVAPALRPIA